MYKLKLMNEYEFMKIFGCLEVLLALHQGANFVIKLKFITYSTDQTKPNRESLTERIL